MPRLKLLLKTSVFFTIAVLFHAAACANTPHDINSLNDITIPKDTAHTLFVFDIDNTLLTETAAEQYIGSPMWFAWQSKQIASGGPYAITDNLNELYPFNDYVLGRMISKVCEPAPNGTQAFMQRLQHAHIAVITATAREPAVFQTTLQQLTQAGLASALSTKRITLPDPTSLGNRTFYQNGLLLLTGQNKGQFVHALLKQSHTDKQFTTIVFIDDTQKNIDKFIAAYQQYPNVHLYTYHYNHELAEVQQFQQSVSSKTTFLKNLAQEDTTWYQEFKNR